MATSDMSEPFGKQQSSLKDELKADRRYGGGNIRPHKMVGILESMPDDERGEWEDALIDLDITCAAITRGLVKRGHTISVAGVKRYREMKLKAHHVA